MAGLRFRSIRRCQPKPASVSLAITDDAGNVVDTLVRNGAVVGNPNRVFRIVTLDFLAAGGDGYPFSALSNPRRSRSRSGGNGQGFETRAASSERWQIFWRRSSRLAEARLSLRPMTAERSTRIQKSRLPRRRGASIFDAGGDQRHQSPAIRHLCNRQVRRERRGDRRL